ncbi:hypothetical protein KBE46_01540 [Candidatus Saccharibacteria bacterium]|nr:hypothetical protein [Candidatus Saccharibacteria bacterium]MBP9552198.1 hypothetical protein [Candidatus Saccharibacteria bacterium]
MKNTKKEKPLKKLADDQNRGVQKNILEELFYDIYPNRWEIYRVNFFRGISFGFGSAIGATVLVVVAVMVLNLFVNIPGGIGNFVKSIVDAMNQR